MNFLKWLLSLFLKKEKEKTISTEILKKFSEIKERDKKEQNSI